MTRSRTYDHLLAKKEAERIAQETVERVNRSSSASLALERARWDAERAKERRARYYGTAIPEPPGPSVSPADVEWCEEAGVPRADCVACREGGNHTEADAVLERTGSQRAAMKASVL